MNTRDAIDSVIRIPIDEKRQMMPDSSEEAKKSGVVDTPRAPTYGSTDIAVSPG
jgi:hypothetical protein